MQLVVSEVRRHNRRTDISVKTNRTACLLATDSNETILTVRRRSLVIIDVQVGCQTHLCTLHRNRLRVHNSKTGTLFSTHTNFNPLKTKCVLRNIYKNSIRTSQETHYVSTRKPNLLFTVRTIWNTQIHYVRRMRCSIGMWRRVFVV
jgi:hypothetical protein